MGTVEIKLWANPIRGCGPCASDTNCSTVVGSPNSAPELPTNVMESPNSATDFSNTAFTSTTTAQDQATTTS